MAKDGNRNTCKQRRNIEVSVDCQCVDFMKWIFCFISNALDSVGKYVSLESLKSAVDFSKSNIQFSVFWVLSMGRVARRKSLVTALVC